MSSTVRKSSKEDKTRLNEEVLVFFAVRRLKFDHESVFKPIPNFLLAKVTEF